jgi:hypothetical protein
MHDGFCRGGTSGNDLEQGLPLLIRRSILQKLRKALDIRQLSIQLQQRKKSSMLSRTLLKAVKQHSSMCGSRRG